MTTEASAVAFLARAKKAVYFSRAFSHFPAFFAGSSLKVRIVRRKKGAYFFAPEGACALFCF